MNGITRDRNKISNFNYDPETGIEDQLNKRCNKFKIILLFRK